MKRKNIIYICLIVFFIGIIFLILFHTIFYNYRKELSIFLDNYYEENTKLEEIASLYRRYKNNSKRINTMNLIVDDKVNDWINRFNKNYETKEDIEKESKFLIEKVNNFALSLPKIDSIWNKKDEAVSKINDLIISKKSYLDGLKYFNDKDYSNAYDGFSKVIKDDSYFDDTTIKIDVCISTSLDIIKNKINELNTIGDNTSLERKVEVYKSIVDYLAKTKSEIKFDLTKSRTYIDLEKEYLTDTLKSYGDLAKKRAEEIKYPEAINVLNEGIEYLTNYSKDAKELIELKEEYLEMLPISLTTLEGNKESNLIKTDELALIDNDNHSYANGLTFYNTLKSNYKKASIIYSLDKKYKYLTGTITAAKDASFTDIGQVRIYGDDKLIYSSDKITSKFKRKEVNISLNSVSSLKIEFTINYGKKSEGKNEMIAILGNPTLSKY